MSEREGGKGSCRRAQNMNSDLHSSRYCLRSMVHLLEGLRIVQVRCPGSINEATEAENKAE